MTVTLPPSQGPGPGLCTEREGSRCDTPYRELEHQLSSQSLRKVVSAVVGEQNG